jgi:hypothetical protein
MDLVTASVAEQAAAFERMVLSNPTVATIVERMPRLGLPDCYLAAGALYQTVWNCLSGQGPRSGIRDYDLNYFDPSDLSGEAEAAAAKRGADLFADLDATLDIRNEARVHLWYEDRFGVPCPPYASTEAAIMTFPSLSTCYGIRPVDGALEIYAPYGFADLFAMRARPNPVLAPREVYEAKVTRWRQRWPAVEVMPWSAR